METPPIEQEAPAPSSSASSNPFTWLKTSFFTRDNASLGWSFIWRFALVAIPAVLVLWFLIFIPFVVGQSSPSSQEDILYLQFLWVVLSLPVDIFLYDWVGKRTIRRRLNLDIKRFIGWAIFWRNLAIHVAAWFGLVLALAIPMTLVVLLLMQVGEALAPVFGIVLSLFLFAALVYINLVCTGWAIRRTLEKLEAGLGDERLAEQEAGASLPIRRYALLFDLDRYGINVLVGVGFLLASVLSLFIIPLIYAILGGYSFSFPPLIYLVTRLPLLIIEAAVFVILSYAIRREWLLPLAWGAFIALMGIGFRTVMSLISSDMLFMPPFDVWSILSGFFWSAMFMAGLVLAVRLWGPRVWSLMLGPALCILPVILGIEVMDLFRFDTFSIMNSLTSFFASTFDAALTGALIYAGLALHLHQRGFRFSGSHIVSENVQPVGPS
ncbi:MAG: hypothetical protein ACE5G0_09155 [Rhodothermales bacterium]